MIDNSYCLIKVIKINKKIEIFFINPFYKYPICFTAYNLTSIFLLLNSHDAIKILSVEHLLYIGKELFKADMSLSIGQLYVQE